MDETERAELEDLRRQEYGREGGSGLNADERARLRHLEGRMTVEGALEFEHLATLGERDESLASDSPEQLVESTERTHDEGKGRARWLRGRGQTRNVAAWITGAVAVVALGASASFISSPRPSLEIFTEPLFVPANVEMRPLTTLASLRAFHWGPTRYVGTLSGVDYFASLSLDSFSAAELAEESVCLYGLSREREGRVVVVKCESTADFAAEGMVVESDEYQGDTGGAGVTWGPTGDIRPAA